MIVDADMRKLTLHFTFGHHIGVGLSNVLSKQGTSHEAIQETPMVGISVSEAQILSVKAHY